MIIKITARPKFKLGSLVQTIGTASIPDDQIEAALNRYVQGDWGVLDAEDSKMNDDAVASGEDRILAKYTMSDGTDIYIITEWDRSVTTILLPEEY